MTKVVIKTNKGNINLQLFDADAPLTVASFLYLIRKGYYNGLKFHRVIENFMVQGGCPLGSGTGSPKAVGVDAFQYLGQMIFYPFKDEFQSGRAFDKSGLLAMANAGPNTNGSQFFITHVVTDWLTNKHTIFGEILTPVDQAVVNTIQSGDKILEIQIF